MMRIFEADEMLNLSLVNDMPQNEWVVYQPSTRQVMATGSIIGYDSAPITLYGIGDSHGGNGRPDMLVFHETGRRIGELQLGFPHTWGCVILSTVELSVIRES